MDINKEEVVQLREKLFKLWEEYKKDNNLDAPEVGMSGEEYYNLCKWIKGLEVKNVLELGIGVGSLWVMVKRFVGIDIIPADCNGRGDNKWVGFMIPDSIYINKIKMPEDYDKFKKLIIDNNVELVILDNGHETSIVDSELKCCYEAGVEYVIVHDVKGKPGLAIKMNSARYNPIRSCANGNGLALLKRMREDD